MSVHERRVRTLRLQAPNDALVRRGRVLLEDALHTASFPSAAAGRLLVVRRLALGRFPGQASPAMLALRMEERLRDLASRAVYAEDSTAVTAPAVFFQDEVEPYVRLALRLALRQDASAWFWRSAVPAWQPGTHRAEALRLILHQVLQLPPGVLAAAAVVSTLHEHGALDDLLAALRWEDGAALVRASGWSLPGASTLPSRAAVGAAPYTLVPAYRVLHVWSARWGQEDARCLWLAATLLVHEMPARLLQPDLLQQAQRLLTGRQLPSPARAPLAAPQSAMAGAAGTAAPTAMAQRRGSKPVARHPSESAPEFACAGVLAPGEVETRNALPEHQLSPAPEPPRPTAAGGLLFLVPALARLGMGEWLVAHPELIELDIPARLLQEVARRMRIPADDPLREALGGDPHPRLARTSLAATILPVDRWRGVRGDPGCVVRRVDIAGDAPRVRLLLDASGRLPLALWRGRASAEIRGLVGRRPLHRRPSVHAATDATILLQAWLVALRRWCRRYARLGLHGLVRRPGRVRATRTHLDILFDNRQADIRVRRVGLDLDPGWVPWLGRVVHFHYLYAESFHA